MADDTPLSDHDRRRLRATRRIVLGGLGLGVAGAAAAGLLGLDGRVGFVAMVLGIALGCVAAALVTAGAAILDETRRQPVATRRLLVTVALFSVGAVLLLAVLGLSASGS